MALSQLETNVFYVRSACRRCGGRPNEELSERVARVTQRRSATTQSSAVTGWPSWKLEAVPAA